MNLIDKPYSLWREGNLWYGWIYRNNRYIFNDIGSETFEELIKSFDLAYNESQDKDTYSPGISISKWSEEDEDMGIITPFLGRGR